MRAQFTIYCLMILFIAATFSPSHGQLPWTKYPGNPVLRPGASGSWEDFAVYAPFVLKDGDTFKMWYSASKNRDIDQSGYATSVDGITWKKDPGNPVFRVGTSGSWDEFSVVDPYIIKIDTTYHMWYAGTSNTSFTAFDIGYAISSDGITWEKYSGNPVLKLGSTGSWDGGTLAGHSVYYDGETFHMWYGASAKEDYINSRIGYATSSDGIIWEKYEGNPVFNGSDSWDKVLVYAPRVIVDGSGYKMWYSGWDGGAHDRIGYASSSDGISWKSSPDFVLNVGSPGEWDDTSVGIQSAHVILNDDSYHMWYTGMRSDNRDKLGYATAPVNISVPDDYATIQGAIDAAKDGNIVLVDEGTYYENINFKGKAITVASQFYMNGDTSHISKTIIDGSKPSNPDSGSVVYFDSGEDTTSILYGLTITNGTGTEVQYTAQGVTYNARSGGGILCWNSGGRFVSNKIMNNTCSHDEDVLGGGFFAGDIGSDAHVILEKNQIINNKINGVYFAGGGGVMLSCNGKLVDNNVISYNSCTSTAYEANGGGVKITAESASSPRTVLIKGNQITHNFAEGKKVSGHHSSKGGGIVNHYCKVIVMDNVISNNRLGSTNNQIAYGAGINMNSPNNGSLIIKNIISHNTIDENMMNGGGGGIRIYGLNIPITNNIITDNSALNGGGIYLLNSDAEVMNNTIVNNTATSNGGGLYSTESNPVVVNTIFWGNEAVNGAGIYPSNLTKVYYSDIQGGWEGEGNIDADPQFIDTLKYTLSEFSPCVGTGIDSLQIANTWYLCPETDIYGNPRPNPIDNFADMGATESKFPNDISNYYNDHPTYFNLHQNYPNPFNPVTSIEYQLPKVSHVDLSIYNLLGQEVTTLVSQKQSAGQHQVTWDAGQMASGIYYYQLVAGEFREVKKMILLR